MKLLSRSEELILLAICKLNDNAYCVPILDSIQGVSDKKWTLGGIYVPLYRLERNGYVTSVLGESSAERGGKSKRIYEITKKGVAALKEVKKVENSMWEGVPEIIFK